MFLSPFQILLNELNHELNEKNLQCLIHICGDRISGAQKELISSGWELFSILRQQNLIGCEPEKIRHLLEIIQALRPKRKDLVHKIKQYIQTHYESAEAILKDFESSSDSHRPLQFPPYGTLSRPTTPVEQEYCCRLHCCGCNCNYNPSCDPCLCCGILAVLFSILTLFCILAWYVKVPEATKYLNENEDLRNSGPYVIACFGLLAVCSFGSILYIKRICSSRNGNTYSVLPHNCYQETTSTRATYASSECESATSPRRIDFTRRCSCSSGHLTQYTVSSSLASRTSARLPQIANQADTVTDGPQPDHVFFSQDVALEEGESEEM